VLNKSVESDSRNASRKTASTDSPERLGDRSLTSNAGKASLFRGAVPKGPFSRTARKPAQCHVRYGSLPGEVSRSRVRRVGRLLREAERGDASASVFRSARHSMRPESLSVAQPSPFGGWPVAFFIELSPLIPAKPSHSRSVAARHRESNGVAAGHGLHVRVLAGFQDVNSARSLRQRRPPSSSAPARANRPCACPSGFRSSFSRRWRAAADGFRGISHKL